MKELNTKELINELIKRGAIHIENAKYSNKKIYLEEKRFTNEKIKSEPKSVLILDKII